MKYLAWLLRAAVFFVLFAFALNNQHAASVHFFMGHHWNAPMVLVVLAAFALGLLVGVLGMLPRWLALRLRARRIQQTGAPPPVAHAGEHTGSSATGSPIHGV